MTDALTVAAGCALMALSVVLFYEPNEIVPGGVTGLAMILRGRIGGPGVGVYILLINAPLFILSWIFVGRRFLLGTLIGTVLSSLMIELFTLFITPPQNIEMLAAAVLGGLLSGLGLGLIFLRGVTTGGSDVAARLFKLIFPHVQIGHLILAIDVFVVGLAGINYGDINNMVYAAVTIYIATVVINAVLYGMNIERVAYIISDTPEAVTAAIDKELERGVTLLHGEGGYSGTPRKIILCAVKRQQIAKLKHIVADADPAAFVILMNANEVLGEGFQGHDRHGL